MRIGGHKAALQRRILATRKRGPVIDLPAAGISISEQLDSEEVLSMETTSQSRRLTVLNIPGMHCGGCARTIEKALNQVAGVEVVKADPQRKMAEVAGSASEAEIVTAVVAAGYDTEIATNVPVA